MAGIVVTKQQLQAIEELSPVLVWRQGKWCHSVGSSWFKVCFEDRVAYRLQGRDKLLQLHGLIVALFASDRDKEGNGSASGALGADTAQLTLKPGRLFINKKIRLECDSYVLRELRNWLRLTLNITAEHTVASHERCFYFCDTNGVLTLCLSYRNDPHIITKVELTTAKAKELLAFLLAGASHDGSSGRLAELGGCLRSIQLRAEENDRDQLFDIIGSVCGYSAAVSRIDLLLLAADLQLLLAGRSGERP